MVQALSRQEIDKKIEELSGWEYSDDSLKRTFEFSDFNEAFSFMKKVARVAEDMDHHPEWSNSWNKVEINLTTHEADKKVSQRDIDMAGRINKLL